MRRVTLTQYLIEQQRHYGKVSPELRLLIEVDRARVQGDQPRA